MQSPPQNLLAIVAPLIVVVVVLVIRGRRMTVKRPLKPNMLWVMPAVFLGIAALSLAQFPPRGLDYLWLAVALVLGAVLGWQRGRLMKIWIEPETGQLVTQGSGWAVAFLVVLLVLRWVLRTGLQYEAGEGAIDPALINNAFVLFAVGLFAVQRAEMAIRASRLRKSHAEGEPGAI
jgi:hypothetical protein